MQYYLALTRWLAIKKSEHREVKTLSELLDIDCCKASALIADVDSMNAKEILIYEFDIRIDFCK